MRPLFLQVLLLLGLLVSVRPASAQNARYLPYSSLPIDATTHFVTYSGVVPVAGVTKQQLLVRAKEWAVQFFLPNARAWQLLDPSGSTYSCRGTVNLGYGTTYTMLLIVAAEEGSYRYTINQLFYNYEASSSDALSGTRAEPVEHWASYKNRNLQYVDVRIQEVNRFMPELLQSLHDYLDRTAISGGLPAR